MSQTCIYPVLSSLTPRATLSPLRATSTICSSNVAICSDQKEYCAYALAFSQSVNSSGFRHRSPLRSSKITFFCGVDYTLSAASPNYSSVLRWPPSGHRNGVASERTRGQQNLQLHGFFELVINQLNDMLVKLRHQQNAKLGLLFVHLF